MIIELEKKIGLYYNDFCKELGVFLEKHFYPEPNETYFSVFWDDDEYMFIDERLATIKIYNFRGLKLKYLDSIIEKKLEKNLQHLAKQGIPWQVFNKYSYDHYLVIRVNNYIYYEYEFKEKVFVLNLIRVSDRE